MPCDRRVKIREYTAFCHKCLSGSAFLTWAAKIDHGSRFSAFFQILFDSDRRGEGRCAEHVMSAAVSAGAIMHNDLLGSSRFLIQSGQGIELA